MAFGWGGRVFSGKFGDGTMMTVRVDLEFWEKIEVKCGNVSEKNQDFVRRLKEKKLFTFQTFLNFYSKHIRRHLALNLHL